MKMKAKLSTEIELLPEDLYPAVVWFIEYLGKHSSFADKTVMVDKVGIGFQLNKLIEGGPLDGQSRTVSSMANFTIAPKSTLFGMLSAICPDRKEELLRTGDVDSSDYIGRPCLVEVIHVPSKTGATTVKVKSVMKLPAGMEAPDIDLSLTLPRWVEDKQSEGGALGGNIDVNDPTSDVYYDKLDGSEI